MSCGASFTRQCSQSLGATACFIALVCSAPWSSTPADPVFHRTLHHFASRRIELGYSYEVTQRHPVRRDYFYLLLVFCLVCSYGPGGVPYLRYFRFFSSAPWVRTIVRFALFFSSDFSDDRGRSSSLALPPYEVSSSVQGVR